MQKVEEIKCYQELSEKEGEEKAQLLFKNDLTSIQKNSPELSRQIEYIFYRMHLLEESLGSIKSSFTELNAMLRTIAMLTKPQGNEDETKH